VVFNDLPYAGVNPLTLSISEIVLIAVALGCDAFAVGLGVGTTNCAPRQVFRLSFHFGLFQFLMPLVGWWSGHYILVWVETWGSWISFFLLMFIGTRMVVEGLKPAGVKEEYCDPTRGLSLVMLSVATSIDALGVGFSLGVLNQNLLMVAVWIGVVAAVMTWSAMKIGNRLSQKFTNRIEIAGGLILIIMALKLWFI
jgi:putative Mn2+ efflux pump MntP